MKTVEEPTPLTMNIAPAIKVKKTKLAITTLKKKRVIVKKKKTVQLSIAAHIQPYNVVNDLQQQRANITFGQLFQISLKL